MAKAQFQVNTGSLQQYGLCTVVTDCMWNTQKKPQCLLGGGVQHCHGNRQPYPRIADGGGEGIGGWVL